MTTIESLSSLVTARSIRLSKLLAAKSHPDPTFDASSASRYAGEDAELRCARQDLLRAARDLASPAESPEDHILSLTWSSADTANLAVLVRFGLPQLVPLSSSGVSATELASAPDLPEDVVVRTMRYAVGKGIFEEAPAGRVFTHNASSALLAKNEHLRDIVSHGTREMSSIMLRIADALELQQEQGRREQRPKKPEGLDGAGEGSAPREVADAPPAAAFNVVYPEENNVFEYLSKQPALAARYHNYMVARHNTSRWTIEHMLGACDWASLGGKTVVDVSLSAGSVYHLYFLTRKITFWGSCINSQSERPADDFCSDPQAGGSSGHTVLALSQRCPASMRFIIRDIDPVALEQGRAAVASLAKDGLAAADRIEFQMHNLFEKQTVRADIYIFRHIFHDWPNADVVKMLENLVPALGQGARVLVSEGIVPEQAVGRAITLDDQLIR